MWLYIGLYAVLSLFAFAVRSPGRSRRLAILTGVFLMLFIGGRFEVGCDWPAYQARFGYLYPDAVGWLDALRKEEGGFHLFNVIARDFGWGFNGVIALCGLLYAYALTRFAMMAPRPMALLALAFPILVVQLGMSGLRQACATACLMLAYVAFVQRRKLRTAIAIFVASLFHVSAIAVLPMALLARSRISAKYLLLALVMLSPVAGLLLGDRMEVYSDRYVDQIYGENASGGAWFRYAYAALPFLLATWKRRLIEREFPDLYPLIRLFSFAALGLLGVGLVSSVALHRLVYYVLPVSLLCLLCVVEAAFSRSSRKAAWAMSFLAYGAYIGTWFLSSRHAASCYIPYQTWMLGA